jgi:hypothetical protein
MPRNGAGTYTLPTGNPVSAGTIIEADWANDTMEDVADALSDSLSRSGQGGMTAPFRLADGNAGAPGVAWLNETSSGFYRAGSGEMWAAVLATNIMRFTTAGVFIPSARTFTADGNVSIGGTIGVVGTATLSGNATVGGTLGVTGVLTATAGVVGNVTGDVTGNAGTVTNGVYTTGSYSDPAWLVTLNGSKITGNINGNAANVTGTVAPANGGTGLNSVPANGQVLIGNGSGYALSTLTAGAGVSISNGPGSITLAAASSTGLPTMLVVTGTSQLASSGFNYALTNAASTTVTLPASPAVGDVVWITSANGRTDNVIDRNGRNIKGIAANMTLSQSATQLQYVDATYGWAELTQSSGGAPDFIVQAFGIV